jgi:hypothetical protein
MGRLVTLRFKHVDLNYMQLAEKFRELMLKPEYQQQRAELDKALRRPYFSVLVETPDKKYVYWKEKTNVYFFPFLRADIEIDDMENQIAYCLDKRLDYKKFLQAAQATLFR